MIRTPYTIFTPQYIIPTGSSIMAYGTEPLQMPELGIRTETEKAVSMSSIASTLVLYFSPAVLIVGLCTQKKLSLMILMKNDVGIKMSS